jgi:Ribosomal protein L5
MAEENKKPVAGQEDKPAAKVESKPAAPKAQAKVQTPATKKEAVKKNSQVRQKGFVDSKNHTRLLDRYIKEVKPALMKKFEYKSVMQVPALSKIVVNIGVGDATQDSKRMDEAVAEIAVITGQKCIVTKAKKSIAPFKLREGQSIGCKVTLRGVRMYEFFDKLVSISLPRVRDFRGVSKNSFDGRGNYTLGIKEQLIFPEIEYDKVAKVRGMDIIIVTTAKSDEEAYALLKELGMPFSK